MSVRLFMGKGVVRKKIMKTEKETGGNKCTFSPSSIIFILSTVHVKTSSYTSYKNTQKKKYKKHTLMGGGIQIGKENKVSPIYEQTNKNKQTNKISDIVTTCTVFLPYQSMWDVL